MKAVLNGGPADGSIFEIPEPIFGRIKVPGKVERVSLQSTISEYSLRVIEEDESGKSVAQYWYDK